MCFMRQQICNHSILNSLLLALIASEAVATTLRSDESKQLRIHVTNAADNVPISDAAVSINCAGATSQSQTDSNGRSEISIPAHPPDYLYVIVEAAGHPPTRAAWWS